MVLVWLVSRVCSNSGAAAMNLLTENWSTYILVIHSSELKTLQVFSIKSYNVIFTAATINADYFLN